MLNFSYWHLSLAVSFPSLFSCIESETEWNLNPLYFPGVHDLFFPSVFFFFKSLSFVAWIVCSIVLDCMGIKSEVAQMVSLLGIPMGAVEPPFPFPALPVTTIPSLCFFPPGHSPACRLPSASRTKVTFCDGSDGFFLVRHPLTSVLILISSRIISACHKILCFGLILKTNTQNLVVVMV